MEKGVYKTKKKDGSIYYRASLTYNGKHISLGSYDIEELAGEAYREGVFLLNSNLSIDNIINQNHIKSLDFFKAVTLINFRDNGMYIANPLYVSKKMFYYYLSIDEVLKFDADELFYYSSHKIMKRGNHLFVAEYGKQVNILCRYGIRPHSRADRDYIFKNGDRLDFRISNLEILNTYYGVSRINHNRYKAYIYINGVNVIGYYKTALEAAQAYNDRAIMLMNNGESKNYPLNDI